MNPFLSWRPQHICLPHSVNFLQKYNQIPPGQQQYRYRPARYAQPAQRPAQPVHSNQPQQTIHCGHGKYAFEKKGCKRQHTTGDGNTGQFIYDTSVIKQIDQSQETDGKQSISQTTQPFSYGNILPDSRNDQIQRHSHKPPQIIRFKGYHCHKIAKTYHKPGQGMDTAAIPFSTPAHIHFMQGSYG